METTSDGPPTDEGEDLARTESDRRRAIEDTAGVLSGVYPPGYLRQLRDDWPD
jgi:hypothetical protein